MICKWTIALGVLLCWELIVLMADQATGNTMPDFQYAARLSARSSFLLLVVISCWTGGVGLLKILEGHYRRDILTMLLALFAVNHLVHWLYIAALHQSTGKRLLTIGNLPGALAYALIIVLPLVLVYLKTISARLVYLLYGAINFILFIFGITYLDRLVHPKEQPSPAWLYSLLLVTASFLIVFNIYRFIKEFNNGRKI